MKNEHIAKLLITLFNEKKRYERVTYGCGEDDIVCVLYEDVLKIINDVFGDDDDD